MFLAYTVGTNWNQNETIVRILTYIDSNTKTEAACDVHGIWWNHYQNWNTFSMI